MYCGSLKITSINQTYTDLLIFFLRERERGEGDLKMEEDFDSEGSDIELGESEEFEREDEKIEDDFDRNLPPDDPLDRAQEWDLWDVEEEEDDFHGFQIDWKTEGYQPRRAKQFTRQAGLKQPIPVDASPLDVFYHIFTNELWDMLVTETNKYADETRGQTPTNSKWNPVSKIEMKTFVGLCLAFGILKLPARRDFWRQTKWLFQTNVPKAMSRDRFDMIWRSRNDSCFFFLRSLLSSVVVMMVDNDNIITIMLIYKSHNDIMNK